MRADLCADFGDFVDALAHIGNDPLPVGTRRFDLCIQLRLCGLSGLFLFRLCLGIRFTLRSLCGLALLFCQRILGSLQFSALPVQFGLLS